MGLARGIYETMPEGVKPALRRLRALERFVPFTRARARARWIASYTDFQMAARDRTFRRIAYFCHVNRPMRGYYFEFGCHEANTMRQAYKHSRYLFDWTYVAFDSFEGFPEIAEIDRQEAFEPRKCATSEEAFREKVRRAGMPSDRLITVKGFYDHSLTSELRDELLPRKAAVVYVDCDLYVSTVDVLNFIVDFLQTCTIIVFGDWDCFYGDPRRGQRRAWREFRERHPDLEFEEFFAEGMAKGFIFVGPRDRMQTVIKA